jgi:5,10-methylenetetrahydromethanopterin reductase
VELAYHCPIEEIIQHAVALESQGYYRVWVPDTIVSQWEAWLAAGIIMHQTEHIRIGLGVTNPYTRHPVVVGQMAATMQYLSQGRLSLSIGKGIGRFLEKAGIDQSPSAVEECIHILRSLLAGNRTDFNGDAFHIDGMRLRTPPLDTAVPLYLAAIGPASWEVALRVADGVATIAGVKIDENLRRAMAEREIPIAALVPFSLSDGGFPEGWERIGTLDELRERADTLEKQGVDEVIIAYRDLADLKTTAELIRERA